MLLVANKLESVRKLCLENKVKSLYIFGSEAKNNSSDDSDIDLIVDINISDPYEYTDKYQSLKEALQKLFKRKIDLLEARALSNKFLIEEINNTKIALYE
ncbi:MAG: nucleotidyltransferase domain-containing protein [Cyclobacteriaceae bacterium]